MVKKLKKLIVCSLSAFLLVCSMPPMSIHAEDSNTQEVTQQDAVKQETKTEEDQTQPKQEEIKEPAEESKEEDIPKKALLSENLTRGSPRSSMAIGASVGYSYDVSFNGNRNHTDDFNFVHVNGEVAFCIEPGIFFNLDSSFTPSLIQQDRLSIIVYHGWVNSSHTTADYAATQFMIWEAMGATLNSTSFSDYATYKSRIQNAINHHDDKPSFQGGSYEVNVGETIRIHDNNNVLNSFSVYSTDGLDVKIEGNDLVITGKVNAKDNSKIRFNKYPLNCVGTSIAYRSDDSQDVATFMLSDPISSYIDVKVNKYGTLDLSKTNNDGSAGISGTQYRIVGKDFDKTYSTDMTGKIHLEDTLLLGNYTVQEIKASSGYLLDDTVHNFTIKAGETTTLSYTNKEPTVSINLTKQDSVGGGKSLGNATLAGAEYTLTAAEDIYNAAKSKLIYKKGAVISKRTTKADGTIDPFTGLAIGHMKLQETRAPASYNIDPTVYDFNPKYVDEQTAVITMSTTSKERVKSQAFSIIKVASHGVNTEIPIVQGAEFTIKLESDVQQLGWDKAPVALNADGKAAAKLVTDAKGYAVSERLPYGKYRVRETKAPVDLKPVEDFFVNVTSDSATPQTWRVMNDTPFLAMLRVIKEDAETGKPISLSNTTFKIFDYKNNEYLKQWVYYPTPHEIDTFTTGDDGSFTTPKEMMYGRYRLEEIKAADGYLINKTPIDFEITSTHQYEIGVDGITPVIAVHAKNTPVKGKVTIRKEAEVLKGFDFRETEYGQLYEPLFEKGLLSGVTYRILAKEDIITNDGTTWYKKGDLVKEFTTDGVNESVISDLQLGSYELYEVATNENGYVRDRMIRDFELTYAGEEVAIVEYREELWNEKQRASFTFHKEAEESDYHAAEEVRKAITFGLFTKDPIKVNGEELVPTDSLLAVVGLDEEWNATFGIDVASTYYIKELSTHPDYILDEEHYEFTFAYDDENTSLTEFELEETIENTIKRGSIEILKKDNEMELPLEDFEFSLFDDEACTNLIRKEKTDEDGRIVFDELEPHTYYVKETGGDDSFVLDETVYPIELTEHEQLELLELTNTKIRGSIEVYKITDEEPIYTEEEKERLIPEEENPDTDIPNDSMDEDILDEDMKTTAAEESDSVPVTGTMEDTEDNVPVTGTEDGENDNVPVTGTEFALPGVEFELSKDEDFKEILEVKQTDDQGRIVFENLEKGTYFVRESQTLNYYVLDETVHEIVISEHEQVESIKVMNQVRRSWIEVTKRDIYTKFILPDAGFTLYKDKECTQVLTTADTDVHGVAVFDNLLNGTYYLKETRAPQGYLLSDEVKEIVIDSNKPGRAYVFDYYDSVIPMIYTGDENDRNFLLFLMFVSCVVMVGIFPAIRLRKKDDAS